MDYDTRFFTSVFWRLRKHAGVEYLDGGEMHPADPAAFRRLVINYGSAASSKSFSWMQHEVLMNLLMPKGITLILRKVAATLIDSVIPLCIEEVLPTLRLDRFYTWNKSERILTHRRTRSKIIFRGLDNPEKIKSIYGIHRIGIEEATELDREDLRQLNIRIRGVPNLQITANLNPIDALHWIMEDYVNPFLETGAAPPGSAVIHSTFRDNPWIVGPWYTDWPFLRELVRYKHTDPEFFAVYGEGLPGRLTRGGEFYKGFSSACIVPDRERMTDEPLHLTFDENLHPYLTCNVWQARELRAWQIGEVHGADPDNYLEAVIRRFVERYPPGPNPLLYVYGDPSSRKQDTKLAPGATFYSLAEKMLRDAGYEVRDRVQLAPPSVSLRGGFINELLRDGWGDRARVHVCKSCRNTISDYRYVKEAQDGGKFKQRKRHPVTKVTFEEWGHATDANDYFLTTYFDSLFQEWQSGRLKPTDRVIASRPVDRAY